MSFCDDLLNYNNFLNITPDLNITPFSSLSVGFILNIM